jgi:hypothetical protein
MEKPKAQPVQVVITLEGGIRVHRFMVNGMVMNPRPDANHKYREARWKAEQIANQVSKAMWQIGALQIAVDRGEITEKGRHHIENLDREVMRLNEQRREQLELMAKFERLVPVGQFTWEIIVPKSATQTRRAA